MSLRRVVTVALVVTVVSAAGFVGMLGAASGAATGVTDASVTPATVSTGDATTLSVSVTVAGVDTSDGTTGGSVTVSLPDTVDLSGATLTNVAVRPNATAGSGAVDPEAGTVTLSWDDDTGVAGEPLTAEVDVVGVVVSRSGDAELAAAVDADATGGSELQATVGSVTAVASGSDRSVTGTPVTLYLGEDDVDVTGLPSMNPAGQSQQLYGVSGDAKGDILTVDDTLAVDVTATNGFRTGGYADAPSATTPQLSVVRPRVTDVTLSPGATASSVDVTNGSVPESVSQVTLTAERNFADAENVTVSMVDAAGLDVTAQVTDSPTLSGSDERLTLDVSALEVGRYTVTVEGADDLDGASKTVSMRIRDAEKVVSLSKTRVVRGESTVVSVAGAPGDVRYLRLDADALQAGSELNAPTARAVFDDTDAVQAVGADADRGIVYAIVSLDDDGFADVRLQTERLRTDTVDVELTTGLDGTVEDDATVTVSERTLTVDDPQPTVVGNSVTITGTAPESDRVKLYAAVGGLYVPLADGTELAETEVASDDSWEVDVDTSRAVDLPGTYRLVAVADPGPSRLGSTAHIDDETLRTFDVRGSTSLTTVEGALSLSASRTTIAATGEDEFTLSGSATGQSDELRLYHVGPRGAVDLTLVDENAGTFEQDVDGIDTRGTHTYLLVGAGRDGEYAQADPAVDTVVNGRETPAAALEKIRDAYTVPGSDDSLETVTVQGVDEQLTITAPESRVTAEPVSVSGAATNEDGAIVFVELTAGNDATDDRHTVRLAESRVTNGTWNTTLNLTGVEPGSYRLSAETASRQVVRDVEVGTARRSTAASATPPADDDQSTTATVTDASAAASGSTATTQESVSTAEATTATQFPGFGVGTALAAFVSLALVLRERRRRP